MRLIYAIVDGGGNGAIGPGFPLPHRSSEISSTQSRTYAMSETTTTPATGSATSVRPEIGKDAGAAFQELTAAYQQLATRNVENLKSAIQALAAVKSPTQFIEVEQRLIKEGVQAAVSDSQNIAKLTAAVFSAAFEPVKQQIQSLHKAV
jgi:hypothetical protein